jgi:uncharacterized protein (TIGR02145 family)
MKSVLILFLAFLSLNSQSFFAQSGVAVNTSGSNPHSTAMLDVNSTNQGFLPPRMTTVQRDGIVSPAAGLVVYNLTTNCLNFYTGSSWKENCGTCTPQNTIKLTSVVGSDEQKVCVNTSIVNITYVTSGANGATFSGLPMGVSGAWASNVVTISGTPLETGTFTYTVTLTGGCGDITKTGSINIAGLPVVGKASASPSVCLSNDIGEISHSTSGATSIGTPVGLPLGVTASWESSSNSVSISGTPSMIGTFSYSIPVIGSCGATNATGVIEVNGVNTVGVASSSPELCINTLLMEVTHSTNGSTGIGTPTGLPTGVTATWMSNTISINGTPTSSGTFNYSIPLLGGCGVVNAEGKITVLPVNTISLSSPFGTNAQTVEPNVAISTISYVTTGATNASVTGLPAGVNWTWNSNTVVISGTPSTVGSYSYTVLLTGGCGTISVSGSIAVSSNSYDPIYCNGQETAIVTVISPSGKTWMDRNLGALNVASAINDVGSYGDLYQWGRRSDGHQCRNSQLTSILSSIDQPSHANFITSADDWRSPNNDNLWQGVNGVNNPCPSGYRVPTSAEFSAELLTWSSQNSMGAFNSVLKLPLAGARFKFTGDIMSVGSFGYYWTSTTNGTQVNLLNISGGANIDKNSRAFGFSVRCIKD